MSITIDSVLEGFLKAILPLSDAFESTQAAKSLVKELGIDSSDFPVELPVAQLTSVISAIDGFVLMAENGTDEDLLAALADLLSAVASLRDAVLDISGQVSTGVLDEEGLSITAEELARRLLDYLLILYLEENSFIMFEVLRLLGLIEVREVIKEQNQSRIAYIRRKIQWESLPIFVVDPIEYLRTTYSWGTDKFRFDDLVERIRSLMLAFGGWGDIEYAHEQTLLELGDADSVPDVLPLVLSIPLFESNDSVGLELGLYPTLTADGTSDGFAIYASALEQLEISFPISDQTAITISGRAELSNGIAVVVRPGRPVTLKGALFSTSPTVQAAPVGWMVAFELSVVPNEVKKLFSLLGTIELEFSRASLAVGVEKVSDQDIDVFAEAGVDGATLRVVPSEMDGFLTELLPPDGFEILFDLVVGFSKSQGLYFRGTAALELTIPLHVTVGPLSLDSLYIRIGFDGPRLQLAVGLSAGAKLGPLSVAIHRVGVNASYQLSTVEGGEGSSLRFDLLPPTGVGLAVDAEGLTGGGFIEFDTINERYSGMLALAFGEISITAIGLIETKMPDGSKNFSMLISICIAFDPPINLSYGFTLSGVGGLVGVNRTMNTEALQRGIKNRSLDTILFPEPEWVVLNASQIISDMRTIFPACEGRFVVGPMLKLGWGIPNIITGELGVFIELPFEPVRIAMMGQMNAAFPDDEFGILVINLDMLGVINSEKKEMSLQASLFDSGIMSSPNPFKISGDAAMLLTWGNKPDFALAVGGFHPKFDPPPPDYIFSDLKRMQLVMTYYVIIKIDCQAYLALTTNSLQFGARLEVYIKELGAEIGGGVSFDALIIFSPFSFEFSISGYMWVKYQGISLMNIYVTAALSGPNPWAVSGNAKFQILFFDITIPFEISWGDPQQAIVASIDPLPSLKEALGNPGNWSSRLPRGGSIVEQLRPIGEAEDTPDIVIVHPSGRLEVRQNVAPFNVMLETFGNAPVSGHDRFKIVDLEAGDGTDIETKYVKEYFARGQFEKLSSSQKLSLPSFEEMDGGVTSAASGAIGVVRDDGRVLSDCKEFAYESILVKADRTSEYMGVKAPLPWNRAQGLMAGSAARLSEKNRGGNTGFNIRNGEAKVGLEVQRYCIVDAVDLLPVQLRDGDGAENLFHSRTEADQALKKERSLRPGNGSELLVIAECEIPESEVAA